jgi:Bifunctional DNA primase/polymerase, N-terminal
VSRPRWQLRDAAVGYASRGIPVRPLHYPLPHHGNLGPADGLLPATTTPAGGCSCRDPGCGQPAKHPLGSLVPHGVKDATCNRARILAWWTRYPQANIGLATGHRFDVLDVDGPSGEQAIQALAATYSLQSSGPLVRTGGGGWHFYLAPTGLATSNLGAWSMWIGGAGAAMWSPHPAATRAATPTNGSGAAAWTAHPPRFPRCCSIGCSPGRSSEEPGQSIAEAALTAPGTAMRGRPWPRS